MLQHGDRAPDCSLVRLDGVEWRIPSGESGNPTLLIFFETDCPTCHLTFPYLNRLADILENKSSVMIGISQDGLRPTKELLEQMPLHFPVVVDQGLRVSKLFDPVAVPTLFLLDGAGQIVQTETGFDKKELNMIANQISAALGKPPITLASPYDGAPDVKPGCSSRHLEISTTEEPLSEEGTSPTIVQTAGSAPASRLELNDEVDAYEYCMDSFGDALPVVPPTLQRVAKMLESTTLPPQEVVGHVPPNYGAATVEKIAANAVMAGCKPEMMRVLIPAVRATCDEKLNIHGVQATTHFAAPLMIINGPIRNELGFTYRSNVFSNVARANSTLGRALQLILLNLGGALPGEIDMSTLGNPGKFSYCIAENEEENPWVPLHVERGFEATQSTVTIFPAEPPRGISEHIARKATQVLKTISYTLATVWTYRFCTAMDALVVLCPEHVKTIQRDGLSKQDVCDFLFENTGIPIKAYADNGVEGKPLASQYTEVVIDGEPCYRKFRAPDSIKILVAGGTAGKFSAVLGSWITGPRGSQMVTYPIDDNQ